jgi:hypothetical protein
MIPLSDEYPPPPAPGIFDKLLNREGLLAQFCGKYLFLSKLDSKILKRNNLERLSGRLPQAREGYRFSLK